MTSDGHTGLIYFIKVVELRNFSKAGRALGKSPSTVHRVCTGIEKQLGHELFTSKRPTLELTEFGKTYYRYCCTVLDLLNEFEAEIKSTDLGFIPIGYSYPASWQSISRFFSYMKALNSGFTSKVTTGDPQALAVKLRDGRIDFAILPHNISSPDIKLIKIFSHCIWGCVLPEGIPTAQTSAVTAHDIDGMPVLLPSVSVVTEVFKRWIGPDVSPSRINYFDCTQTMAGMVSEGYGVGFAPVAEKKFIESMGFKMLNLFPGIETTLFVFSRPREKLRPVSQMLYDIISSDETQMF